jgi:predicted RNase H-like HicB family nuclease
MKNNDWSHEQKLAALMQVPWTLHFDRDVTDGSLTVEVAELPEAIAIGKDEKELATGLYDALQASLASRLQHGDPLPVPAGISLPWLQGHAPPVRHLSFVAMNDRPEAWTTTATVTAPIRDLVTA